MTHSTEPREISAAVLHAHPCTCCGGSGWNSTAGRKCGVCSGKGSVTTPGR